MLGIIRLQLAEHLREEPGSLPPGSQVCGVLPSGSGWQPRAINNSLDYSGSFLDSSSVTQRGLLKPGTWAFVRYSEPLGGSIVTSSSLTSLKTHTKTHTYIQIYTHIYHIVC